jgi:predicted nucleic acid-binding protein
VEMITADPVLFEYAALAGCMFSLKLIDSIHIASAMIAGCDAFLTNDKRMRGPEAMGVIQLSDVPLN